MTEYNYPHRAFGEAQKTPFKRLSYLVTEDGTQIAVSPFLVYSNVGPNSESLMIGISLSPKAFKMLIDDSDND